MGKLNIESRVTITPGDALIDNFSDKYLFWLKNYYYVGGMLEDVNEFWQNIDYVEVR